MPDPSDTQVIITHLTYLREGFDELRDANKQTNEHLARLNGKTHTNAERIAKLEGRAEEAEKSAKSVAIKWGAVGTGLSALIAGLAQALQAFGSK